MIGSHDLLLADTSVWIDHLRGKDTFGAGFLRSALLRRAFVVVPDLVLAEIVAGARPGELEPTRRYLLDLTSTPDLCRADYLAAAELFRACLQPGRTVRSLADCLIAQICIQHGYALLAADRDFDSLAAVSPLRLIRPEC